MIRVIRFLSVCACVFVAACSSSSSNPSAPSVNVPFSTTDLAVGTGAVAAAGNTATVSYTGWLYSTTAADNKGTRFDGGSFAFRLGTGAVVAGFDQGVTGMRVGGTRRIVIPPNLGYANNPPPSSGIPANATLIFEVTLLGIS